MNISILMSVGCQNLGDELILKNEIKLLKKEYGNDTYFKVFSYDIKNPFYTDDNIEYVEYFPIGIKNPKNIIRNIKNYLNFIKTIRQSDKIIIGGGGIFFDNEYGAYSNPLNQWIFRVNIINLLKKEFIIYGVSLDIKTEKNTKKIKQIFKKASKIYVRDQQSKEFLDNIKIISKTIKDPVFYDSGKEINKSLNQKTIKAQDFKIDDIKDIDFSGKKVGIAFRKGYLKNENKLVKQIIDYILKSGGEIIFLPHSFNKIDKKINDYEFLSEFLQDKTSITKSMGETYLVYKQKRIDLCLSMRLHSMILCESYEIGYIKINYSKKTNF